MAAEQLETDEPDPLDPEDVISCGPHALKIALSLLRIPSTQIELAKISGYSPDWGTTHQGLICAARQKNTHPIPSSGLNLDALTTVTSKGGVAIVNYILASKEGLYDPTEDGHYAVFKKAVKDKVTLYSCHQKTPYQETLVDFYDRWWDIMPDNSIVANWALLLFK